VARIRSIIVERHITAGDSGTRVARDRRDSITHPQGSQDARSDGHRPGPPVERLDQVAEHAKSPITVVKLRAWHIRLARTELRFSRKYRRILRHAARVRQQVMHEYLAVVAFHREPWQVVPDGRPRIELALVVQLQQRERDKGLADGSDLEQIRDRHGHARLELTVAVRGDADRPAPIGKAQGQSRRIHGLAVAGNETIEDRKPRRASAAAARCDRGGSRRRLPERQDTGRCRPQAERERFAPGDEWGETAARQRVLVLSHASSSG
jgi:hypothetical protein